MATLGEGASSCSFYQLIDCSHPFGCRCPGYGNPSMARGTTLLCTTQPMDRASPTPFSKTESSSSITAWKTHLLGFPTWEWQMPAATPASTPPTPLEMSKGQPPSLCSVRIQTDFTYVTSTSTSQIWLESVKSLSTKKGQRYFHSPAKRRAVLETGFQKLLCYIILDKQLPSHLLITAFYKRDSHRTRSLRRSNLKRLESILRVYPGWMPNEKQGRWVREILTQTRHYMLSVSPYMLTRLAAVSLHCWEINCWTSLFRFRLWFWPCLHLTLLSFAFMT